MTVSEASGISPVARSAAAGAETSAGKGGHPDVTRPVRERFWNLPNSVTMLRIGVVPVMLLIPFALTRSRSEIIAWCFIVAASSDVVDGWLARRGGEVTRIGKLLDPLADKLLISTALIMLLSAGRLEGFWASTMVVVIVGRELAVTGLRGIASTHGHIMAATWQGKLKTIAQNCAVIALLFHYPTLGLPAHQIGLTLLAIAAALTLWSGYAYFAAYFGAEGLSGEGLETEVPDADGTDRSS